MASTALQNSVPEFEDPYNFQAEGEQKNSDTRQFGLDSSGFIGRIGDLLGLGVSKQEEANLLRDDREYERQSINSARAWSEYMDNTQYQRRVADLEAAGLNPWLAVQNGISGSGAASADTGGSAQHQTRSGQSKTALGMILLALAKILG